MKLHADGKMIKRGGLFLKWGAWIAMLVVMMTTIANAQVPAAKNSPRVQAVVDGAVRRVVAEFAEKKLTADQLAVTLIDLQNPEKPEQGSHRGGEQIYPASVIKMFYMVALHRWMEDGKLEDTPELRRAMSDMIVLSYNEATSYVVDLLTGTTSGPELPPTEIEAWWNKRNAVNRYFESLGYTNINASKKPWGEGPYGRETQAIKLFKPTRNWLTTDATARLLSEIATGKAVSAKRSAEMMKLMERGSFTKAADGENQATAFTGLALPPGAKLWSKAGWTSQTRHDAAYVELPDGRKFVLVTFTVDHANERKIIPAVAKAAVEGLTADK